MNAGRWARRSLSAALALFPLAAVAAEPRSFVQRESDIATEQPGPHDGGGTTTAYPYFEHEAGLPFVFRKRVLHAGSAIGLHRNDKDEIYYIVAGRGELTLQGETREVTAGDAVLTRNGHEHGLRPLGNEDLVIFVVLPPRLP